MYALQHCAALKLPLCALCLLPHFSANSSMPLSLRFLSSPTLLAAAVCVVVLVTAVNNYQKERQFRLLQAVSADVKVGTLLCGWRQVS
jgi:hypothetical protein